jgi:hypothetical protein
MLRGNTLQSGAAGFAVAAEGFEPAPPDLDDRRNTWKKPSRDSS